MASAAVSSDEIPPPYSGKIEGSFAYLTIKDRLPVILTKAIDTLHRERHEIGTSLGEDAKDETKEVIGCLSELRNEMVTNKAVIPLKSDGPDVHLWDSYLEKQRSLHGFEPTWFDSPWLYTECYLYRRIKEAFELSSSLWTYDPFKPQKNLSFMSMLQEAIILSSVLETYVNETVQHNHNNATYEEFVKFVEVSLWGNRCDLSISARSSGQFTCEMSDLQALRKNIVVNEVETLWNILQTANCKHRGAVRIDIVLDNAGFELFGDLCLLEFLEAAELINEVHLYVKSMPWYVSDTTASDITWLIDVLSNEQGSLAVLGKKWRDKFDGKKWLIEEEMFWTLPHDFSEMRDVDSKLYQKLSKSDLIIFKGDLNYRKLTADRQWKEETPFATALQGFLPTSLCSLRTIKADVLTGLKPGVKESLDEINKDWKFTGKYAVIQCAEI